MNNDINIFKTDNEYAIFYNNVLIALVFNNKNAELIKQILISTNMYKFLI